MKHHLLLSVDAIDILPELLWDDQKTLGLLVNKVGYMPSTLIPTKYKIHYWIIMWFERLVSLASREFPALYGPEVEHIIIDVFVTPSVSIPSMSCISFYLSCPFQNHCSNRSYGSSCTLFSSSHFVRQLIY